MLSNITYTASVIVTSFNQSETISQTIDSIINQQCSFNFEIIIGDDCSADNTREIINQYQQKFPDKIFPLYHEINMGVASNFALSVQKARGKFIGICAADDFWHNPNKLQLQVDYFEKNTDCGFIYTDYNKLNVSNDKLLVSFLKNSKTPIFEGENLIKIVFSGKFPALTLTVMFRKDLFDKYIPVDDYLQYKFTLEDWPTWLILSKHTKIAYLPVSTATYRYGHESISNPVSYDKIIYRFNREKLMYKYLCDKFPDDISYDEKEYDSYVQGILLGLAFKKNDFQSAQKYATLMLNNGDRTLRTRLAVSKLGFYSILFIKKAIRIIS